MKFMVAIQSLLFSFSLSAQGNQKKVEHSLLLMGSRFEIAAVNQDRDTAVMAIKEAIDEIKSLENVISSHRPESLTSRINEMAGVNPVKVPYWYFNLIKRSLKVSELTDGAFDISYAVLDQLWNFKDESSTVPSVDSVKHYKSCIDYRAIKLSPDTTVFLERKGMRIGFGGIGKGFAANRARQVMQKHSIKSGYVDASGDVLFWGNNEKGMPWKVGVTDPENKSRILGWLEVNDMAVATSGNYENFIQRDSIHYSHILNPKTGWPIRNIKSVTIVCPDAELADALATAITILGSDLGLNLVNKLRDVECLLVTSDNEVIISNNLRIRQTP